jgi:putative hydrolase of the HAD superfamily
MRRQPARGLLIDLDGVVRRWDPEAAVAAEAKYGLEPGILMRTAMTWDIYRPAVAGEITDAEWMQLIAMRLPLPTEDAAAAVAQWQTHRGSVDDEVLGFVRDVRAAGLPVGLATNATDRLPGDLDTLGLTGEFDIVVSSYELKIHKPAPEFFERAVAALGLEPHWILFVDDDDRAIRAARVAGLPAYRWSERRQFHYLRAALGLG